MAPVLQHTRPEEITRDFLYEVDKHLQDIVTGKAIEMYEIETFADLLHIHPTHVSNTIKQYTGKSPCHFYQEKIMEVAKQLLTTTDQSIRDIAFLMTYDPSNFSKVFKRFVGVTPKQYRTANT
ncbi:helix-turn-helix domain-containing protein [Mucilaginibacter jinjuensis]|uniref:AraC family transcriptional regulator n=1 Tax=Mucilaginibacter jinjuensis TaxID=1176721 RepID=A0ABY7T8T9_9SPHI|nr:AraC family transcriptional regulator [Mucilaginibacter jinjuensis]WCT12087.1 AraC family transcriptional regulator [Mucilaginibacter jinjuensis]